MVFMTWVQPPPRHSFMDEPAKRGESPTTCIMLFPQKTTFQFGQCAHSPRGAALNGDNDDNLLYSRLQLMPSCVSMLSPLHLSLSTSSIVFGSTHIVSTMHRSRLASPFRLVYRVHKSTFLLSVVLIPLLYFAVQLFVSILFWRRY